MERTYTFIIFSADTVFRAIMQRLLMLNCQHCNVHILSSYAEAKHVNLETAHALIIDDKIEGATSLELIAYLRSQKKIISPLYYLSVAGQTEEKKALLNGVNFYFEKPFYPDELIKHLKKTVNYV